MGTSKWSEQNRYIGGTPTTAWGSGPGQNPNLSLGLGSASSLAVRRESASTRRAAYLRNHQRKTSQPATKSKPWEPSIRPVSYRQDNGVPTTPCDASTDSI